MSDSDLQDALAELSARAHPDAPILSKNVEVSLTVNVADAQTPQAAVAAVVNAMVRQGLDNFIFLVRDLDSGESFNVLHNEIVTTEALEEMARGESQ